MSLEIHIVTGGSGRTAETVLRSCLAQFEGQKVPVILHQQVREAAELERILERMQGRECLLLHTLVDPEMRHVVTDMALQAQLPSVDLLGPTLSALGDLLSEKAMGRPGLMYELHREQFDRMDAVDFTMAHDDGNRLYSIAQADVVVTGLSRMSKSVTCFYLATRGVRAANVPLIHGVDPPRELLSIPAGRVFGLTMNASHLASIRQARLARISRREVPEYAGIRELNREIYAAERLMEQHGWHRLDVSYMATEEVAAHILDTIGH
ncbi:MAG: kinase/pyrophosphorylase [bacterium]|nr:kinase/pyrophosphorylase [bacterium]